MALGTMSIMVRFTILKYDWISSSVAKLVKLHMTEGSLGNTH